MPDRVTSSTGFSSSAGRMAAPLVEELVPPPDPVRAAELLSGLGYRLFLDSATPGGQLGRYSFLSADPVAVVRSKGAQTECIGFSSFETSDASPVPSMNGPWRVVSGDALAVVRELLAAHLTEPVPGLPPFQGGAAGYLAYEWGRVLEGRLPEPRHDDLDLPDVVLGVYDWVLAWDHDPAAGEDAERATRAHGARRATRAWLISTGLPEINPDARSRRAGARAAAVRALLQPAFDDSIDAVVEPQPVRKNGPPPRVVKKAPSYRVDGGWWKPGLKLRSSFTHEGYLDAVSTVREYILAGDVFQSNLSQRFEVPLVEGAWALYCRLRSKNAAPFAAFLDFGEFRVLSASPERFLHLDVGGHVETRPIKGTRPRGVGPEHDAALGLALIESVKDRAENLMIVDLMRNDLSRVCKPGTVRVEELFGLERYASVHHLVSTVAGELAEGMDATDLLRAAFPGGSVTGAPKIRAMEIITELEPSARGVYCGSIGYWSVTGALDMNIAIRTAVSRNEALYFNAGGGIVLDSDPEQEYRETLDKARGIIDALPTPV